jgi:hypothetical protein
MLTLISTTLSFLMGGLPKLLAFFQDRQDKKHEILLAQMQMDQQMKMQMAGFASQEKIEAIHTEQIQIQADVQERQALYQHDIEIGKGASQWVINLRSSVRPVVTYMFVILLMIVDISGIIWAWSSGLDFYQSMKLIFDQDEMQILVSIIAFWFGTQAFSKK